MGWDPVRPGTTQDRFRAAIPGAQTPACKKVKDPKRALASRSLSAVRAIFTLSVPVNDEKQGFAPHRIGSTRARSSIDVLHFYPRPRTLCITIDAHLFFPPRVRRRQAAELATSWRSRIATPQHKDANRSLASMLEHPRRCGTQAVLFWQCSLLAALQGDRWNTHDGALSRGARRRATCQCVH